MNGFVILNKAEGITSFKAASILRKIYNEKKIGHTGTLDPMATGVLPIALGKATRFIDFIPFTDKGYKARFKLGITTDTLDITGKILTQRDVSLPKAEIEKILPEFSGDIQQLPPMYSAISKDGVRLYELARKGIEVERELRTINIKKIELTDYEKDNEFEISVACSKGTYIRSLISDIGERLGTGAVMTALQRTLSNGFSLNAAKTQEQLLEEGDDAVLGIDYPFMSYPEVKITSLQANRFSNGGELSADRLHTDIKASLYRVYSPDNIFLGLGEIKEDLSTLWVKRVIGK